MTTQFLIPFWGQLRREFLIWKSYGFNAITSLLMWAVIFPILILILQSVAVRSGVPFGTAEQQASLLGFLAWRLCMIVLTAVPRDFELEARVGTLESVVLSSRTSMTYLLTARAFAHTVFAILEAGILYISLTLLFGLDLRLGLETLAVVILMLLGIWGMSFIFAGMSLLHKSVTTVVALFANIALLLAIIPSQQLGAPMRLLKVLFPMTWGIELLQKTTSLETVSWGNWGGLFLQAMLFLGMGWLLFNHYLRQAKKRGVLEAY